MKSSPQRLKAFTITELIIVMILSTIVFSMALTAFQISSDLYKQYDKSSSESIAMDRARALLGTDIANAKQLYIEENTFYCMLNKGTIIYKSTNNALIRTFETTEEQRPDTIIFGSLKLEAFFEDEMVTEGLFNRLIISGTAEENSFQFFYKKPLDAAYFLNKNWPYEHRN